MEPSNDGPSLMRSKAVKPNPGLKRRPTPYPTQNDYAANKARNRDMAENKSIVIGTILVVIVVVAVVLIVIWMMMRSKQEKDQQNQNIACMTKDLPRGKNNKILLAEGSQCNTDEDCRDGLRCFRGQCRSLDTIQRVQEVEKHPKPTPQQLEYERSQKILALEKEREQRLKDTEEKLKEDERKKEEKKQKKTMKYKKESAREAGLRARLRTPSATANAEQDFGW